MTALLLITAAPALGLILLGRAPKTALTLALAFPAALAALFIAANIALAADSPVGASAGADVMSAQRATDELGHSSFVSAE